MKKLRRRSEGHENQERWLLTYADLITLLLGLFVILYAMSKIDANKYSDVMNAFGGVFGRDGIRAIRGTAVLPQNPSGPPLSERHELERELQKALHDEMKSKLVSVSEDERGVTVHLTEELLFASGEAGLKQNSLVALDALASVLKATPNDIRIEGHTDDIPINTALYPSNWHLSVARAMNTGFYLLEHHGLNPAKLSIVGFSQYRPLADNGTPERRAKNRRVDIVVVTDIARERAFALDAQKHLVE